MYKVVNINGVDVPMLANAATPYRIKQIFHIDIIKAFMNAKEDDGVDTANIIPQLAYVMNCQANKVDMNTLNEESFYEWCEQFGAFDLIEHSEDIIDIYLNNQNGGSTSKKK